MLTNKTLMQNVIQNISFWNFYATYSIFFLNACWISWECVVYILH